MHYQQDETVSFDLDHLARGCLSVSSTELLPPPAPLHTVLFAGRSLHSPHLRNRELGAPSFRKAAYVNYLKIFRPGIFASAPHLLIYLITYISMGCLFYTWGYNPVLLCFSSCSNHSSLQLLGALSFGFVYLFILAVVYFLELQDASGSSCAFRLSVLELTIFPKVPWFCLLENGTRNQDLGSRYACCYWDVTSSWSSQQI